MKAFLLFTIGFGGSFLFGPQVLSGTSNSCHAAEQTVLTSDAVELNDLQRGLGALISHAGRGAMMRRAMMEEYPGVPPAVMCSTVYWLGLVNEANGY